MEYTASAVSQVDRPVELTCLAIEAAQRLPLQRTGFGLPDSDSVQRLI
jgi:hypothetical protein